MMLAITRILCPIDFSEFSARAYQYACSLANHYSATVTVQHIVEQLVAVSPHCGSVESLDQIVLELKAGAKIKLDDFVRQNECYDIHPEMIVQTGFVDNCILSLADQQSANLIVMGTHGRRGWNRFALGSVAEKILRKANCPVLVVRKPIHDFIQVKADRDSIHLKKILFCTDFSENSDLALKYALSFAAEYGSELTLVHVLEDLPEANRIETVSADLVCKLENAVSREARRRCSVRCLVRVGKPHQQIIQLAVESEVEMVVMGVTGRSVLDLELFGSTTHRVLQLGTCPVFVVPPEARAALRQEQDVDLTEARSSVIRVDNAEQHL